MLPGGSAAGSRRRETARLRFSFTPIASTGCRTHAPIEGRKANARFHVDFPSDDSKFPATCKLRAFRVQIGVPQVRLTSSYCSVSVSCVGRLEREDGANPSRSRRCNRGRWSQMPFLIARVTVRIDRGEGAANRMIREPEDLPTPKPSRIASGLRAKCRRTAAVLSYSRWPHGLAFRPIPPIGFFELRTSAGVAEFFYAVTRDRRWKEHDCANFLFCIA